VIAHDQYRVVFDLYQKGFQWRFPAYGLIFVFVGALLLWLGRGRDWPPSRRLVGYCMIGFACLWSVLTFATMLAEYLNLSSDYRRGQFSVVEGLVTNFRPMPYEGHREECFSVQSQAFCYSDYEVTAGFNNSASHGGPIREGLPVRVFYVGNTIIRLEVAPNTPATPNAAKSDPLGLYGPENKNLADCLSKANPGDPAAIYSETQAQEAARKACGQILSLRLSLWRNIEITLTDFQKENRRRKL
jgi:hypothetical protein